MAFVATVELFDAHMSVNVRGVFLAFKHAALQMIKQGKGGRLIGKPDISFDCVPTARLKDAFLSRFIDLW